MPQTTESKVSVNYTQNMGVFDGYLFSIDEPGVDDIFKRKEDVDRTVNFQNLQETNFSTLWEMTL